MAGDTDKPRASDASLRGHIGYQMKRVYILIQEDLAMVLAPLGLRTGTYSALAVVAGTPGMSQTQLGQVLDIQRSGIVALVDELEKAGLVARAPAPGDRRTNALTATAKGQELLSRAAAAVTDHEARLMSDLEADDLARFQEILGKAARSAARNIKRETK